MKNKMNQLDNPILCISVAEKPGKFGITVNNILPGYTDTQRLQEIFLNKSKKNK